MFPQQESVRARHALYYPFHLCNEQTLKRLLEEYHSVHFRDYMAIQLTPMSGTMAYKDRMGAAHPDLLKAGRIIQGYDVSGPLDEEMTTAVDRDLSDPEWRSVFHHGLLENRRFQRGLFDFSHGMLIGGIMVPGPAAFLRLAEERRKGQPFSVATIQRLSIARLSLEDGYTHEYGLALLKTSASLVYTIRLARQHGLEAVTDSPVHFELLERTCARDHAALKNKLVHLEGY